MKGGAPTNASGHSRRIAVRNFDNTPDRLALPTGRAYRDVPLMNTLRNRLVGATLAAVVALVAVAGAWHEHAFLLEGFHVCAPGEAAPKHHDHDCLACKIAPPFATPWNSSTLVDPGLTGGQTLGPHEAQAPSTPPVDTAAPRGPPLLPQA
jgi:hypothetical protein